MNTLKNLFLIYNKIPDSLQNTIKSFIPNSVKDSLFKKYKLTIADNSNCFNLPLEQIRIEVSSLCNLRCKHCASGSQYEAQNRELMSIATFENIVKQLNEINSVQSAIMYLGGEPLLNKNLPYFITELYKLETMKQIHFNTNGMLLNDEISRRLLKTNIDLICVSIDGTSAYESEQIRIGSNYESIRNNIYNFIKISNGNKTKLKIANTQIANNEEALLRNKPEIPLFLKKDFGEEIIIESNFAMK